MKVMLVCNAGMSTGILAKKLKKQVMVNLNVKHMGKLNILTILKKAMNYC